MGRPAISSTKLSDTLTLSEHHDGFWLYDHVWKGNLSMRAKTPQDALVEVITYYQERLAKVEGEHRALKAKVDVFVDQFREEED